MKIPYNLKYSFFTLFVVQLQDGHAKHITMQKVLKKYFFKIF